MNPISPRTHPLHAGMLAGVAGVIAFRLWTSFCFFPLAEWNHVRLAPTFMLWFGPTPYPGLDGGPLTTWIYGPVPLLLNLPAVLAHDTIPALFIASLINLLGAILPAAMAVFSLRGPSTTRTDRLWALWLCLALWPNSSLQYIQADNWAVAFGLLSNGLLLRARGGPGALLGLAGLSAALAVWSKQTALGLVAAQLLWLGWAVGLRGAGRYAIICAVCGLGLGAGFIAWFGFDRLWLNLVRIPGGLPFGADPVARTLAFWMHLAGYVLLPAAGLLIARRAVWKRDSHWLLPALSWLCLLPGALVVTFKIGGATNSLNSFLYLLPVGAVSVVAALRRLTPHAAAAWLAAGTLAVLTQQLASAPLLPLRPVTAQLVEAGQLARQFPGQIYFPWHPLVTFFSERRFYHAEDGLYTRHLAGLPLDPAIVRRDLPPAWSLTAIPGWRDEGVYKQLQPPTAQLGYFGKWSIHTWLPGPTPVRPEPVRN